MKPTPALRVYLASSWRNPYYPHVLGRLREVPKTDVYDFRNPAPGNTGFSWRQIDPNWERWDFERMNAALSHPAAQSGFAYDADALRWCDVLILLLPSGRSAALEAGWAAGSGKRTCVLFPGTWTRELTILAAPGVAITGAEPPAIEPELMHKLLDVRTDSLSDVLAWVTSLARSR